MLDQKEVAKAAFLNAVLRAVRTARKAGLTDKDVGDRCAVAVNEVYPQPPLSLKGAA